MRMRNIWLGTIVALGLGLTGCDFGDVQQGRCVAFDADKNEVTIVLDVKHDQRNPEYTGGAHKYLMPADPKEIGPLPAPGGCVDVNPSKKTVTVWKSGESVEEIAVTFTDVEEGIDGNHPKVKGKTFPIIDKEKKTVTVYVAPKKLLATFTPPADRMDEPESTWKKGDEVRIYYKENAKHQALRFMNITKTNIFKR